MLLNITSGNSESFSLSTPRLSHTFRVQQPDTSDVPRQPGDIVFHQQPITELHFYPAQDISQPCSYWGQEEGWVGQQLVPVVTPPSFSGERRVFHHLSVLLSGSLWLNACRAVNKAVSFHLTLLLHRLTIYHFILIFLLPAAVNFNLKSVSPGLGDYMWSLSSFRLVLRFVSYKTSSVRLPLAVKPKFLSLRCLRFVLCCS